MTHPKLHPALKTPLVAEAVFEVRFLSKVPYGLLPGRIYESVQGLFPLTEELPAAQIPIEIDAPIPRHRFKSTDQTRMAQVGVNLFSLNHTGYAGFEVFRAEAEHLLRATERLELLTDVKRLGLRYINRARLEGPAAEIVTYSIDAPKLTGQILEAQRITLVNRIHKLGVLQTAVAWPVTDGNEKASYLVLDFDLYIERKGRLLIDDAMSWLDESHEHVYQAFRASLQPDYLSKLEA